MLTIGQDLYRLTLRDEETLLIDPWFKVGSLTIPAGTQGGILNFTLPLDRAFYFDRLLVIVNPGAAQTALSIEVEMVNPGISQNHRLWDRRGVLTGDGNSVAVAGVSTSHNIDMKLVIPPSNALRVVVNKSVNTNEGSFLAYLSGFMIPPGRIGRGF